MKPKKYEYYNVDCGFFPAQLKLCFSDAVFQQILKDHKIDTKEEALELGLAETHVFQQGKRSVIVVVFDLAECLTADPSFMVSTIAHESVHCAYRVLEYAGEEEGEWGEETFAYLTDHIAKQIYVGIQTEATKRAGKENRAVPKQKGKRVGRVVPKIPVNNIGSTRQNDSDKFKNIICGAENDERGTESTAKDSI
jgi:hypothetical protein